MSNLNIFDCITELLSAGESLVLATIINRSGSAPRSAGARMAILKDGSIVGTIGGGILEARIQDLARDVFRDRRTVLKEFTLTAEDASLMGMVCGGQVQVLVHFLDGSDPSHLELYSEVRSALKENKRAGLITQIPLKNDERLPPEQALYRLDGSIVGTLGGEKLQEMVLRVKTDKPELMQEGENLYFLEPLGREATLFIFGAGHVSRELASLAKHVGFRTIVLDDRSEFANRDRFACADEVIVLEAFDSAMERLDVDEDSYLVLVTRGHQHDGVLLRLALRTKACYIGMIGSRRKREAIYEAMRGEGFTNRDLERVRCPIGIKIGAESPEEIAVSIVAELIQERGRRRG